MYYSLQLNVVDCHFTTNLSAAEDIIESQGDVDNTPALGVICVVLILMEGGREGG